MGIQKRGKIVIITGPSSVGRDSVVVALKRNYSNFAEPIVVTTRGQRTGEISGEYYRFESSEDFERGIECENFLFWEQHMGNYYGVCVDTISEMLSEGKYVILNLNLGDDFSTVKKLYPDTVSVFIIPPDPYSMIQRLFTRENNNVEHVQGRLNVYETEAYSALRADSIVVNHSPDETAKIIFEIIRDPNCAKKYYDECVELVVQMKQAIHFVRGDLQSWLKKEKSCLEVSSNPCDEVAIAASISRSNAYIQQQVCSATQLVEDETKRLRVAFGAIWEKLLLSTQTSLISAGVLWASCSEIEDQNFDYSGICITTTCGLESSLKSIFYTGFQKYLENKYGSPDSMKIEDVYSCWPEVLLDTKYYAFKRIIDDGGNPKIKLGDHFTMGMLPYLFYNRNPIVRDEMNEYLKTILNKPDAVSGKWWAINTLDNMVNIRTGERDKDSFVCRCEQIREAYRNPAAHSNIVSRTTARACSEAIVGRVDAFKHNMEVQGLLMELYSMLK